MDHLRPHWPDSNPGDADLPREFDGQVSLLQLPDASGDQVYKTAKQIDPDLNVIVITGYPDSEMLDRILQISPVTVLKKPLQIEQLNQTVKILSHSSARVERRKLGQIFSPSRIPPRLL